MCRGAMADRNVTHPHMSLEAVVVTRSSLLVVAIREKRQRSPLSYRHKRKVCDVKYANAVKN